MTQSSESIRLALMIVRGSTGGVALVHPSMLVGALGGSDVIGADGRLLVRMFGVREVLIAALSGSRSRAVRRVGLRMGVMVDAGDALVIARSGRSWGASARPAALAGFFAVLGSIALSADG